MRAVYGYGTLTLHSNFSILKTPRTVKWRQLPAPSLHNEEFGEGRAHREPLCSAASAVPATNSDHLPLAGELTATEQRNLPQVRFPLKSAFEQ